MSGDVAAARLGRLREAIAEQGLGALLVRDTSNIQWATAFDGVFDEEQAHALYVCPAHATLHTDSRYAGACRAAAQGGPVEMDDAKGTHAAFAARMWSGRPANAAPTRLGIEDSITLAEYRKLQRAFAGLQAREASQDGRSGEGEGAALDASEPPFAETDGVVLGLRAVKDADELARMRAAQAITDAAFEHIVGFMRPGMTERQVQLELEDFMARAGADALAFPSIVATGPNGANPHAIPGDTVLEAGQCVVLDFGAKAQGYCSDMTRTVFLGAPEGQMLQAWETLRRANEEVEAFIQPGVTGKACHELAERLLAEGGFEGAMGHGLGHGVGLDIHELPVLNPRNDEPLQVGNVVTVEPGIYVPGCFGMRLEDCGVVTEHGFDRFTQSTHEMVIV